jgi:hypothetical protein
MCGPERDKITGGWRKLHNEELHNLYSTPDFLRMRWAERATQMGEIRNAYRILVEELKGTNCFGRLKYRWDDIKMDE